MLYRDLMWFVLLRWSRRGKRRSWLTRRGQVRQWRKKILQRYLERLSKRLSLLRQSNQHSELQSNSDYRRADEAYPGCINKSKLPSNPIHSSSLSYGCISLSATQRYQGAMYSVSVSNIGWNCRGQQGGHVVTINTILTRFQICIGTDLNSPTQLYGPYINSRFCHWSITIHTNKMGQYLTEKPCIQLVQVISCQ